MASDLRSYLLATGLSELACEQIAKASVVRGYEPGEIIAKPGDTQNAILFVESGIVRSYEIINGEDKTDYFLLKVSLRVRAFCYG